MAKKSNFLKNLLTTASAMAVITAGASSAYAGANRITTGDPATIALDNGLAGFVNGDTLQLGGAHNLITSADHVIGAPINIAANANQTFTVAHNVTYGAGFDLAMNLILNAGSITLQDVTNVVYDVTVNGGTLTMRDAGRDLIVAANGVVTTVRNVLRNVELDGNADVTATGTVGGTLGVDGGAIFRGDLAASRVNGAVTIDTTNAGLNIIGNSTGGAVLVTKGKLQMGNHTHASAVTLTAGELTVGNITDAAGDLVVNGGTVISAGTVRRNVAVNVGTITQVGNITGTLGVGNGGLVVQAGNVGGAVTINTVNPGVNTIGNAAAVTLTAGNLTMNNSTVDVTAAATAGNLIINGNVGNDLLANGGVTTAAGVVRDVTVDGATNATVLVQTNVGRNAAVANGGKLEVVGNVVGTIDGAGEVHLSGDGSATGAVGGGARVTKMIISGNRTFANAAFGDTGADGVRELNFAADGKKVTLQDGGASILATDVTLGALTPLGSVIEVKEGNAAVHALAGAINAAGKKDAAGKFALTINMTENLASEVRVTTANFKTNLTSTFDNRITLNLNAGSVGDVGNLGLENAKFVATNFNQTAGAEVSVGDIYSNQIAINAGRLAKFRGKVVGTETTLADNTSKAKFADGATLDSAFVGVAGGLVEFEGGAFINKAIRGATSVKFLAAAPAGIEPPKQAVLRAGIAATIIEAGDTELFALENVRMDGATTAKYIGADSGKNERFTDLKLTGNVIVHSNVKKLGGDVKTGVVIVENNPLNLQNVQSAIVVIDDSDSGAPVEGKEYQILRTESGVVGSFDSKLDVINLRDGSSALYAARTDNLGNIYLTQKNNTKNNIENAIAVAGVTSSDATNLKALSADKFIADELADMNLSASKAELAQRLVASDVEAVLGDLTTRIGADLGSRMGTLAGLQGSPVQTKVVSNGTTGLSAGDDVNRYGAWISPFFNKSTQKSRKEAAGYTATTGGGSFGFDTKANDDMIVGLALSMLHTDVKHKNFKLGDKTKVDSVMFSVYGMQQITDNWFAQGLVTAGSSKVSTNEKRKVSDTAYEKASGKYTSMSFSGEALLGYNYVMDQVSITPMGGVRLTRVNDEGYKETGTTNQNLNISRKALNRAELVLGARIAGGTFDLNGLSVTPEIHGFLNQDVIGKASKVDMTTKGGTKLADKSSKPNKTMFNVGVGLNATYNSMEYGAGYDGHLANKFVGHQGTLKVRVNF